MDGEGRILVFATKEYLRILFKSRIWFVDGTFKTAPDIFLQLFTIHGLYDKDYSFPLVYALLENKLELSYTAVLQAVKAIATATGIHVLDPETVIADFEVAIINAVKFVLPNANLRLCCYHLGQSMWRSVQEHGLQADYINTEKPEVKNSIHQLLSLAFVPTDDVPSCFDELLEVIPDEVEDIAEYFEKNYIRGSRPRNNRRPRRPRYETSLWNQYDSAINGDPKTNNQSEGWHSRFANRVAKYQPSLYSLINELKREQADAERLMAE